MAGFVGTGEKREAKTTLRWENYFLRQTKKYYEFWKNYLTADKSVLFVMGSGFDPRMCLGLESILQKCGDAKIDCILIDFVEGRLPSIIRSPAASRSKQR